MRTGYVMVSLEDLGALADKVCELDGNEIDNDTAGEFHDLIMKMMGEHVDDFYAADDGSERVTL
jgi:hypothetical protein